MEATAAWLAYQDLEARRKQRRLERWNVIDALYQAYVTALSVGIAVVWVSGLVADPVSAPLRSVVARHGPATVGSLFVLAVWLGLASGLRGGPLTVTTATVRTVLLAPLDRGRVLRAPAVKQLRFGAFVGLVGGAIAGVFAHRRLEGDPVAWVVTAAAFGALLGISAPATALVACGRRPDRRRSWFLVGGLAALSLVDLLRGGAWSPLTRAGAVALAPMGASVRLWADLPAAAGLTVALAAMAALGIAGIGGLSVEAVERRSQLVTLLKFAATLRDLRGVILFRRMLSQEAPRSRPWFDPPRLSRGPILRRDLQALARWPSPRLARILGLGVVAGVGAVAAHRVAIELVAIAAGAVYVAAAEAAEGAAQEEDHPTLSSSLPVRPAALWVGHLMAPTLVMCAFGVAAVLAAWLLLGSAAAVTLVAVPSTAAFAAATTSRTAVQRRDPVQMAQVLLGDPTGTAAFATLVGPPLTAGAGLVLLVALLEMPDLSLQSAALVTAGLMAALVLGYVGLFGYVIPWWRERRQRTSEPEDPLQ